MTLSFQVWLTAWYIRTPLLYCIDIQNSILSKVKKFLHKYLEHNVWTGDSLYLKAALFIKKVWSVKHFFTKLKQTVDQTFIEPFMYDLILAKLWHHIWTLFNKTINRDININIFGEWDSLKTVFKHKFIF